MKILTMKNLKLRRKIKSNIRSNQKMNSKVRDKDHKQGMHFGMNQNFTTIKSMSHDHL